MRSEGIASAADWHTLEYGAYGADLPTWRRLSSTIEVVADLGCGCGRVSVELARAGGVSIRAIDRNGLLLDRLSERIAGSKLQGAISPHRADLEIRGWSKGLPRPELAIAPMQLWQQMAPHQTLDLAGEVKHWLRPEGLFAISILDTARESGSARRQTLDGLQPTLRELDGWVLSTQIVSVTHQHGWIEVERARQQVAPDGEIIATRSVDRLRELTPCQAEVELRSVGFQPVERIAIPPEPESVPCMVVVCAPEER